MRPRYSSIFTRPALLALVGCGYLIAAGCGPADSVSSYKVAKSDTPTPPAGQQTEAGEFRFLGAMYPADDPVWFVKFAGPASAVDAQAEKFDAFLKSLKMKGGDPEWTLPDGWKDGPTRNAMGITIRTVQAGSGDSAVELTVSRAAGGVVGNVSRWVGQVGASTDGDVISKYTKPVMSADEVPGVKVDVSGPKNPAATRGPFMGGR